MAKMWGSLRIFGRAGMSEGTMKSQRGPQADRLQHGLYSFM